MSAIPCIIMPHMRSLRIFPLFESGPVKSCPKPHIEACIPVSIPTVVRLSPLAKSKEGNTAQRIPSFALLTTPAHVIVRKAGSPKVVA